jgi:hypothetical protein
LDGVSHFGSYSGIAGRERGVSRLLGFFPKGLPICPGTVHFHVFFEDFRLKVLKILAKIGFFLVRDPVGSRFGTFIWRRLVII